MLVINGKYILEQGNMNYTRLGVVVHDNFKHQSEHAEYLILSVEMFSSTVRSSSQIH